MPTTLKSPQTGLQVDGLLVSPPIQLHPTTLLKQSALHLSVPLVSPSSQNSPAVTLESPQSEMQSPLLRTYPELQAVQIPQGGVAD